MVRSHTQELLAGPRLRSTCDRCHAQKLRCVKTVDLQKCLRCAKHRTSCTFSARSQRKVREPEREHATADRTAPLALSTSLLVDDSPCSVAGLPNTTSPSFDSWTMDFSNLFPTESVGSMSTSLEGQDTQPLAIADAIRELANLNVRLYNHFCTLPAPLHSENTVQTPDFSVNRFFAIDETFTLTRSLITLLKRLQLSLDDPLSSDASIDQATTLLILSCYHRLLDVYGSIASNIRSCSQNPQLPWPGEEPAVRLPPLQIGSYIPAQLQNSKPEGSPSLSTVSMHMMVMLTLSTQLCEQLREIITGGLDQIYSEHMPSFGMTGSSLHAHVSDMIIQKPSRIFDDKARRDLDQRWYTLTNQFSNAKQAVVLFSAASM
ncbi:hypothetical protein P153DRAFT_353980 [Dothidotthia symphoricarpi CBS 119687]|uniref:Zn(2)-C6 fungal-type domain-containing protein n=1 Tax=Dothidotthia symphoricarpi CBS 119687 TaxID=1392245 RepID=A0A6A6ANJ5_9PLEO|nr:uncharacterized protein P153DRAFT_353980 [Dothidotthia symphoricarpi CBS 119687]KAF2132467.1 hypothetical protein P153DRAFT_353980 [Dothidotthia symphoricarpi CBS 119687]